MKKIGLIFLLVLAVQSVFAQGKLTDEKRKEFEAQKVAFFTRELDLSPSEAALFWPLYNEMQKKRHGIEGNVRKEARTIRESKGLKETDYKEAIGKMLDNEARMQALKKEYYQKMLAAIPASKIWKLGEAERKFHRQLFEKLRLESAVKK